MSKSPLSTGALKLIAMFFMTLDHIGAYLLPQLTFLRILGRISAPLFLFCAAEGLRHTKNRKRYLLRLYLMGVAISVSDRVLTHLGAPFPQFGNILFTFLYVGLYTTLLESLLQKKYRALLGILATAVPVIVINIYNALFPAGLVRQLLCIVLPSPVQVSYSYLFVLLGMGLYFAKTRQKQVLVYAFFCLLCLLGTQLGAGRAQGLWSYLLPSVFFNTLQPWMLLVLPFIALYNGEKGPGCKWLFYTYYPLHRYALCLLAAFLK